jgi:ABC-type amino acid transport system permease subunit
MSEQARIGIQATPLVIPRRKRRISSEAMWGMLCVSPAVLGFLILDIGPMLSSFVLSLTDWSVTGSAHWVGTENYSQILTNDALFRQSAKVTLIYALISVPLQIVFAILLALLLNEKVKGLSLFRTIFYIPSTVPLIASSVLWLWMYNPDFGLFNVVLDWFGLPSQQWIYASDSVMMSLVIMSIWSVGPMMIIFLAGLTAIPQHLYDAVSVDGGKILDGRRIPFFKLDASEIEQPIGNLAPGAALASNRVCLLQQGARFVEVVPVQRQHSQVGQWHFLPEAVAQFPPDVQRLLVTPLGGWQIAQEPPHGPQRIEGRCLTGKITCRDEEFDALFVVGASTFYFSGEEIQVALLPECIGADGERHRSRQRQRPGKPLLRVCQVSPDSPVAPHCRRQANGVRCISLIVQPGEGRQYIWQVEIEASQPGAAIRAIDFRADPPGERHEVPGVAQSNQIRFLGDFQLIKGKFPDRLQHGVPRFSSDIEHGPDQALIDQRFQGRQHGGFRFACDGDRRIQREAASKHTQPAKQCLLVAGQQVMTPGDRALHCLEALRLVPRATGEQWQPALEAIQHGGWGKQVAPRRRQFDRQRQAIEPPANLGDRGRGRFGSGHIGSHSCGAGQEQPYRLGIDYLSTGTGRGQGHRRDRERMLAADAQGSTAGDQQCQARAGVQHIAEHRRGCHDLFEVVEQEQATAPGEMCSEPFRQ